MVADPEAAEAAFLIQIAMDMHNSAPGNLAPPADPRLATLGYSMVAPITGTDYLPGGKLGAQTVLYGLLLQDGAGAHTVALRGTDSLLEWIEDGEFVFRDHPKGGRVETGFYGVYETLQIGGTPLAEILVRWPAPVRMVGHSLAAALAAYATLDVPGAEGIYLAQPKPGDQAFARMFDARVKTYRTLNYWRDVVPDMPLAEFGNADLPRAVYFKPEEAQAQTNDWDIRCRHSCLAYGARLDFARYVDFVGAANAVTACIKGATTKLAA